MKPALKLLLQPFQVRNGRGWNSGHKTLPPASLQHLVLGCAGRDGMQTRESGGLTGSAEILEERDRDGMKRK